MITDLLEASVWVVLLLAADESEPLVCAAVERPVVKGSLEVACV